MEPLTVEELEAREQPELSEMERAVQSLVNLEDITQVNKTPEQIKSERAKPKEPKSMPMPPTKPDWHLGLSPAIGDVQKYKPAKPYKEIMRTHVFDPAAAQAGMMVVYGATTVQAYAPSYYHTAATYY